MSFKKVKKLAQQSVLVASLTAATAFSAIAQSNDNNSHHNGDKDKTAKPKIENVNDNENNKDNNDLKLPKAESTTTSYEARGYSREGTRFAIHVGQDADSDYSGEDFTNNLIQGFANPDKMGGTGIRAQAGTYADGSSTNGTFVTFYIDGLRQKFNVNGRDNMAVRLSEVKQLVPEIVQRYKDIARREGFKAALVYPEDYKPTPMPE